MTLQLRLIGFTDTGFSLPLSMQTVNKNIYKVFGDSDMSSQERGEVIGTTDLLHIWDDGWNLTVAEVVVATGLPADRIVIVNTD